DSHARDIALWIPWSRMDPSELAALVHRPSEQTREWAAIEPYFRAYPTLAELPDQLDAALRELHSFRKKVSQASPVDIAALSRVDALLRVLSVSAAEATELNRRLSETADTAQSMFLAMDFTFLFDTSRKLFSIGFRAGDGTLDASCYDLLASEARLTSFLAVAKGEVPSSHWFHLGRALTAVERGAALVSWSGSMFEYLMPALVMRSPSGSMLSQTYQQIVL